jgi:hypothetical protein
MAGVHEQWVIELFSGCGARQKDVLYSLLGDLKHHLTTVDQRPSNRRTPRDKTKEHAA